MLSSCYVRRELVSVLTSVTTEVTLKGVSETMAAHMNGVHDMVQEQNTTVFTPVRSHLFAVCCYHLEPLGSHLHAGLDGFVLPLLFLLHQRQDTISHSWGDVVGQVDEARGRYTWAVLIVALSVCGVLATVARRAVFFTAGRLRVGQQQQVFSCTVFGWHARPGLALWGCLVEGEHGAEAHIGRGGRGGLNQRPEGLGFQVADGTVDGLVDDLGLGQLPSTSIVREIWQAFVPWKAED